MRIIYYMRWCYKYTCGECSLFPFLFRSALFGHVEIVKGVQFVCVFVCGVAFSKRGQTMQHAFTQTPFLLREEKNSYLIHTLLPIEEVNTMIK